jgi:hypothetical protein
VIVAHDVSRRCAGELGGSGSLMLDSSLKGIENHTSPFRIGDLDPQSSFVHVLDDTSLDIVMSTVNTISDFTAYLDKKEALFRSPRPAIFAAGEEELLAIYLKRMNSNGEHDFALPDSDGIALAEGFWEEFHVNPQRIAHLKADEISYLWDELIEHFSRFALAGEQHYTFPPGFKSSERIMRFLAREPRVRRRMLARALAEILEKTPENMRATRIMLPSRQGDPYYVFLLFPYPPSKPYEEYREVRRSFLLACCQVAKLRFPQALDIVGIATEAGPSKGGRSEDAIYFDARGWTDDDSRKVKELQKEFGLLENLSSFYFREKEYPDIQYHTTQELDRRRRKNPRNKPCPCGSGMKYKK